MSDNTTLLPISPGIGLKSKNFAQILKVTAWALAAIYAINSAGTAAGYANKLPANSDSSIQQIADVVWVGVSWPLVVHDMLSADGLSRIGPLSEPGT